MISFLKVRITDGRGRSVPLIPARMLTCEPHVPSPLPLATRNRVWVAMRSGAPLRPGKVDAGAWAMALGIPIAIAMLAITLMYALNRDLLLKQLQPVMLFAWIVPTMSWTAFWAMRGARAARKADLLVSEGFCPSCAYSIADLPPEPDDCVVCPECGAAWAAATPADPPSPPQR